MRRNHTAVAKVDNRLGPKTLKMDPVLWVRAQIEAKPGIRTRGLFLRNWRPESEIEQALYILRNQRVIHCVDGRWFLL